MNQVEEKVRMRRINVVSLQMTREKSFPYRTNTIKSPNDAYKIAMEFIGLEDREHIIVICLDTKNKVSCLHTVAIGSLNSAIIHPREVFKAAILANSASIVIAHNHPSGNCTPSAEDITVTKRIGEAGKILGIDVLDHVIVSESNYYSMKEKGYL